ncbi:hypothetical protein [Allonocardiopsis opalescens]|uniref:Tail protein n=1 Tax=Allonocardiopsis opalescens TaxID=1144618 RepID=A0A2T0PSX0_9ACTN|nr:hypothetical protein [Allonocardiopsis opalescens]PRX91993.1 hypothetical protein CLV72_11266 [Allonocardiopsis opalescens]
MTVLVRWSGNGLTPQTFTTSSIGAGDSAPTSIGGTAPQVVASGVRPPRVEWPAADASYIVWEHPAVAQVAARWYVELTALTGDTRLGSLVVSGATSAANVQVSAAGALQIQASGSVQATSADGVIPTGVPVRIEILLDTSGTRRLYAFAGDTTTLLAEAAWAGPATTISAFWWGHTFVSTHSLRYGDDLIVRDLAALIGPAQTPSTLIPVAPSGGWQYHAMRILGRTWIDRDLPLSDVQLTYTMSGPSGITATINPEYATLKGADGAPVLDEWSTLIVVEKDGQVRAAGILVNSDFVGSDWGLECSGIAAYPQDMQLTATTTWGGSVNGTTGHGVDPLDVVRGLWAHLQGQPDGDLGVVLDGTTTPYRLGEWHNARRLPTEAEPEPDPKEVQDPPIPIDRVWTSADQRPQAAQGRTLFWRYQLPWYDNIDIGQRIDQLSKQTPFDFLETAEWADSAKSDVRLGIRFGYPRLGTRRQNLRFVEGENITAVVAVRRDGDGYANEVRAYGSGEGTKQLRQTYSQRDGRLRRVQVVDHPEVGSKAALRAEAKAELLRVHNLVDVRAFTVRDHPNASIGSFAVGDDVLVQASYGWLPVTLWVRITQMTITPESGDIRITCARSDSFNYSGSRG